MHSASPPEPKKRRRKRKPTPPDKATKYYIIWNMCMKADHSFGLRLTEEEKRSMPLCSGMTQKEAAYLESRMEEFYDIVIEGIFK